MDLKDVEDAEHRAQLDQDDVIAMGIEDFKLEVAKRTKRINEKPVSRAKSSDDGFVVLKTTEEDVPLAKKIAMELKRQGLGFDVDEDDEVTLNFLIDQPGYCDALMVIYGQCKGIWVKRRLRDWRTVRSRSETPPLCALFDGPPPNKPEMLFEMADLIQVNCRDTDTYEQALRSFITAVKD